MPHRASHTCAPAFLGQMRNRHTCQHTRAAYPCYGTPPPAHHAAALPPSSCASSFLLQQTGLLHPVALSLAQCWPSRADLLRRAYLPSPPRRAGGGNSSPPTRRLPPPAYLALPGALHLPIPSVDVAPAYRYAGAAAILRRLSAAIAAINIMMTWTFARAALCTTPRAAAPRTGRGASYGAPMA